MNRGEILVDDVEHREQWDVYAISIFIFHKGAI
jgi:hypothetical protein